MPKSIDWIHFIYINLGFIAQILIMYIYTSVDEIKKDWPKYRCNPMYMPLSDNISQDFTYCVQNTQVNFMGYLLEPLTYITSNLSNMGSEMTGTLNNFRVMISNIRTFVSSITGNIMGVFMNLIIEFQKIIISIIDLVGKIAGILAAVLYLIDGGTKTLNSAWNGPFGQQVRAMGGSCFHPDTVMYLKDGVRCKMKNIEVGSILENGSRVISVMKLVRNESDKYYKITNGSRPPIFVTGTHFIYNSKIMKFEKVKDFKESFLVRENETLKEYDYFSCLITDNHLIDMGGRLFYDYEDDILEASGGYVDMII